VTKKQQTILLAIIGVVAILAIVAVGVGVLVVRSLVDNTNLDQTSATKAMEDVRARFGHVMPAFDVQPGGVTMARRPPDARPSGDLKTLHVLRWDVHDERLTRVDLPFWMIRWRNSSFDVMSAGDTDQSGGQLRTTTTIRVADVERFGSTLLVDGAMPDGGHLMIWSE
jgi:hypothetical protein